MKIDFRNIDEKHIDQGRSFYLYGNNKKTFDVFCDFIYEKLREKSPNAIKRCCSFNECLSIINGSCDLFGTEVNCFCIRNIEDSHQEKLPSFPAEKSNIFILESGDYAKSKKITDFFQKSSDTLALASFKNDATLHSLCKMLLPNTSTEIRNEVVKIINETDEELTSLFKKVSLLLEDSATYLEKYITQKRSFLTELDFIPLIRYLSQYFVKEEIFARSDRLKIKIPIKDAILLILNAEIKQKQGLKIGKSYLYRELF